MELTPGSIGKEVERWDRHSKAINIIKQVIITRATGAKSTEGTLIDHTGPTAEVYSFWMMRKLGYWSTNSRLLLGERRAVNSLALPACHGCIGTEKNECQRKPSGRITNASNYLQLMQHAHTWERLWSYGSSLLQPGGMISEEQLVANIYWLINVTQGTSVYALYVLCLWHFSQYFYK